MTVLDRLLPPSLDNHFQGSRGALWILGAYIAVKIAMSGNSIFNPAKVARTADGIPLDTYPVGAAHEVTLLFALVGLGQLALAAVGLMALVRYRAMVPLVLLLLLSESLARRVVVWSLSLPGERTTSIGVAINLCLIGLLAAGLLLSFRDRASVPASLDDQ